MSDMFGHHTCEGNLEKSFYNLLLLADHYTGANVTCSNCIVKHISDVIAYTEEGLALDNAAKYTELSADIIDTMQKHLKVVLQCTNGNVCKVKDQKDMLRMMQEVRSLRRRIGVELYGIDSDVASDAEGEHSFMHKHSHEYSKAIGADLHDDTRHDIDDDIHIDADNIVTGGGSPHPDADKDMAVRSLEEEHIAYAVYGVREKMAKDPELKEALHHARGDEGEHIELFSDWLDSH